MPPQQDQRLLDLVNHCLLFGPHPRLAVGYRPGL
jgi:hypothetical protein